MNPLRILYLVGSHPWRSYGHAPQRFRNLAQEWSALGHHVDVIFPYAHSELETHDQVRAFGLPNRRNIFEKVLGLGKSFHFCQYGRAFYKELANNSDLLPEYDYLMAEELKMAPALWKARQKWKSPTLLTLHNVESDLERQISGLSSRFYHLESQEKNWIQKFDEVLAFTAVDAQKIKMKWGIELAYTRPGVSPVDYRVDATGNSEFVFIGALDYFPNIDGLRWLSEKVWPKLNEEITLLVAGKNPSLEVRELCQKNKWKLYESPVFMDPIWQRARASLVPLLIGSGARGKILESLACGVPVVTTDLGAEGLSLKSEEQILVCNDPTKFARGIERFVKEDDLIRRQIAQSEDVLKNHSYKVIAQEILDRLAKLK